MGSTKISLQIDADESSSGGYVAGEIHVGGDLDLDAMGKEEQEA
jgi:hypothetical protein